LQFKIKETVLINDHFYVITSDQNWHHLRSSSARGKDLSNDTQIRMTCSVEQEICTKMLRNVSGKLAAKFPATPWETLPVSMMLSRKFLNWKQAQ